MHAPAHSGLASFAELLLVLGVCKSGMVTAVLPIWARKTQDEFCMYFEHINEPIYIISYL